ncbi:MAG TPA: SDR family NAD(P)-dependent oxidoreductase, partial [Acidimicrobiales bacterium]
MTQDQGSPHDQPTVCLITGSTRGLGRAVAEELARRGILVIVTGRDPDAVAQSSAEIAEVGSVWALPGSLDVADRAGVETAATLVADRFGKLDILINNAAAFVDWSESASAADLDRSHEVMDTNLYGPWNMIQRFLPLLSKSA